MTDLLEAPPRRFEAVSSRVLNQRELRLMLGSFRKRRLARVVPDFEFRPGFIYNSVRAISARVNQNYDAWPSEELQKSYRSFLGKPCFVNHHNEDPTKARGRVIAARYIEKGADKYIDVIQEIDAIRFPKLAHEIITGGLDSVSMGVEAGFTICSICENRATDIFDMCNHVKFHKGERMINRRTGKKELVYERCYKLGFFELSYVFDPADETAVVSRVIAAGRHEAGGTADPQFSGAGSHQALDLDGGHKLMIFPPTSPVSPVPGQKPKPAQWEWVHMQGKPMPGHDPGSEHYHDHEVVNHGVSPREEVAKSDAMGSYQAAQGANRLDADTWDPDRDPHDPRHGTRRRHAADGLPGGTSTNSIPQITPTPGGASFPYPTIGPGDAAGVTQGSQYGPKYVNEPDGSSFLPGKNVEVETPYEWSKDSDNPSKVGSRQWLAYGETHVPEDVDTLRDDDDDQGGDWKQNDFHHWIESPSELQDPDLGDAHRLDQQQEDQGLDDDRRSEDVEEFGAPSAVDHDDPRYTDSEHKDDEQPAMPINPPAPRKGRRMTTRGVPMSRSYRTAGDEDGYYGDDAGGDDTGGYDDGSGDYGPPDDGGGYDDGSGGGYDDAPPDDGSGGDDGSGQDPDELITNAEQDLADYEHEQAAGDDGGYESDDGGYDDGGDAGDDYGSPDDGGGPPQDDGYDDGSGQDAPPWEDNRQARRSRGRAVKKRGTRGNKRARTRSRGGSPMARGGLADRHRVAANSTRHFAGDNGYTDGGPYGEDGDQGLQSEVFISDVPSAEAVSTPSGDEQISNGGDDHVARRRQALMTGDFDPAHYQKLADTVAALPPEQRHQVAFHMAKTMLADNPRFNWGTFYAAAEVPWLGKTAMRRIAEDLVDPDKVDPPLSGTDASDMKGSDFESLALDDVETQPKDASIHAFRQFDSWLKQVTGKTCRQHGNANYIRRCAISYANAHQGNRQIKEAALAGLFPTLEFVLREARKIEASQNRRANMRRRAEDTSMQVAAPGDRIDVEKPVKNVTDAEAQSSQFDLGDFANNAGDGIADPVLDVVDGNAGTWAPDEGGTGSKEASVRLASTDEALRCAMAYQKAMPRKYGGEENLFRLTARFETTRQPVIRERIRLLAEVIAEQPRRKQVTAGRSRGTAPGIPIGRMASRPTRVAANDGGRDFISDPNTDSGMYF